MIQNLLNNWRTTSLGLTSILGAVVNIVFAIKKGIADQGAWTIAITQILAGVGIMASRDQAASKVDKDKTVSDIATLKAAVATGDTSQVQREVAQAPAIPVAQPSKAP